MTELATFGIYIAIILLLLIIVALFAAPALLLVFIFPVVISEAITGEGGTFSPNGSGKKSPLFKSLTIFFVILQVLLVATVLYGIHRLIAGPVPIVTEVEASRIILTPLEINQMLIINGILWLATVFFTLLLLFNLFRLRGELKKMPKNVIFLAFVLPLFIYPFVYIFLYSTRNYLTYYPQGDHYLSSFSKTAGILYCIFLFTSLIREIWHYITVLRKHQIQLKFQYWLLSVMSLFYKILFVYFLICIFRSL